MRTEEEIKHKNTFIDEHCPYKLAFEKFFNSENVMTKSEYKQQVLEKKK